MPPQAPTTGDFSRDTKLPLWLIKLIHHKWRFYMAVTALVLIVGLAFLGIKMPWKSSHVTDRPENAGLVAPGDFMTISGADSLDNNSGGQAPEGDSHGNGTQENASTGGSSGGGSSTGGSGGSGSISSQGLPAPINPGDRDFGRIIRTSAPNGGIVVLPDGNYTVSDVSGFNPSKYVVVVAQNPLGAKVVRTANVIGQTDQYITNSSKVVFVGIDFRDIQLALNNVDDFYFWQTRHSFPIGSHPDPSATYCASRQGPEAIVINGGSNRLGFYGSLVDGVGHDGFKLSSSSNITLRGVRITDVNHGGLQQGRGNSSCGWDGDDNYHTDSIQIYPGGVSGLTVENSYIGRQAMLQVDNGGTSNANLVFRNNMFYQEPSNSNCVALNVRVKPQAQAGATQTMTMQNNETWCYDQSDWVFVTQGTRDGALVVNGTPIPSSMNHSNSFTTRRIGVPNASNTPHHTWRAANPYDDWPCYIQSNTSGFTQSIKSC